MRAVLLIVPWALVVLCFFEFSTAEDGLRYTHARKLMVRDLIDPVTSCRNTVSGRVLLTDDRGVVCPRTEFDYTTGCCSGGQKHSCEMCDLRDQCCTTYEHCVSCCMAPGHNATLLAKSTHEIKHRPDTQIWKDGFEYCKDKCRTHATSTQHENAYIHPNRHHCFSALSRPLLDPPRPADVLKGVKVIKSAMGQSCDAACAGVNQYCSPVHLKHINDCDRLRERFGCEAGCFPEDMIDVLPGYTDSSAPKHQRPALCSVAKEKEGVYDCAATDEYVFRLCTCVETKPAELAPTQNTTAVTEGG